MQLVMGRVEEQRRTWRLNVRRTYNNNTNRTAVAVLYTLCFGSRTCGIMERRKPGICIIISIMDVCFMPMTLCY